MRLRAGCDQRRNVRQEGHDPARNQADMQQHGFLLGNHLIVVLAAHLVCQVNAFIVRAQDLRRDVNAVALQ